MNKLLTTIAILCFSVYANADVYVCTEKAGGLAWVDGRNPGTLSGSGPNFDGDTWVIDTEKGMRHSDDNEFSGSCITDFKVICRYISQNNFERVFEINPFSEGIIFTAHNRNIMSVYAYAGACIKT
ncbi:hypothetical protein OAT88_01075 [Gammaproteobacteria bacterium]|nr:hypothetical protein [Gammaproteobacteria bacterium]